MLIKGEKYACEACVRGHRVSNCHHSDRPLQHINKKGRPVSQCTHCRTLRKSRSAHVRCECGEKAHSKGACPHGADSPADDCCCSHGSRCSCALKKDHLDTVPESDSDEACASDRRRPRALTSPADNGLMVFTNGHHKPAHKHNNMAHKCGLPYVVPRAHTIHGTSSTLASRSVDNLPHTSTIEALHSESHIKDSMVSAQQEQRMVKSEHGSPRMNATSNLEQLNGLLPPLDLSNMPDDFNYLDNTEIYSGILDHEQPLYSAGLSATSIDWSHYDGLDFNNDSFATSSYSQAASFTGYEFSGAELQPALTTTSTSGEISEVEDFSPCDNSTSLTPPNLLGRQYGSDFGGDDGYKLSAASSYISVPQPELLAITTNAPDLGSYSKTGAPDAFAEPELSITGFDENGKVITYFDDSSAFTALPVLSAGEDDGNYWLNEFPPSNTSNTYEGEPENPWVQ